MRQFSKPGWVHTYGVRQFSASHLTSETYFFILLIHPWWEAGVLGILDRDA